MMETQRLFVMLGIVTTLNAVSSPSQARKPLPAVSISVDGDHNYVLHSGTDEDNSSDEYIRTIPKSDFQNETKYVNDETCGFM